VKSRSLTTFRKGFNMRTITDHNGTKWTVSIVSNVSLGSDETPEQIAVMTLLFKSNDTEILRETYKRELESFSDNELLEILNSNKKDETQ
jgi:hypothetical protein